MFETGVTVSDVGLVPQHVICHHSQVHVNVFDRHVIFSLIDEYEVNLFTFYLLYGSFSDSEVKPIQSLSTTLCLISKKIIFTTTNVY